MKKSISLTIIMVVIAIIPVFAAIRQVSDEYLTNQTAIQDYYYSENAVMDTHLDIDSNEVKDNIKPIADAGLPAYTDGRAVRLNGSGSYDPDNSPGKLMYLWVQLSGPRTEISDANTANPLISGAIQTDALQIYKFQLLVFDGKNFSVPDTVDLKIIPTHPNSTLALESGSFDPNKPTIVYINGGNCVTGSGSWPYTSEWTSKANCLCFTNYGPDSSNSGTYYHCGDMLIVYLSQIAPNYDMPIQTIGYSTGGQPAMDAALRINMTYKDARYAINRICFVDGMCRNYEQDIYKFMENPVDGEQNWVDEYCSTTSLFYPGILAIQVSQGDHGVPPSWYKDSISNSQKNQFNGGIIAGWHWSVIGPGKNLQLTRTRVHENIYRYLWTGSTNSGTIGFYNESLYPAKMLGLVNLIDPYGSEDSNGVILSCMECENAVAYEILVGTNPKRVMDFKVIRDSNEPNGVIASLPAEKSWWTVRARDEYGSTIYADPIPINSFIMSLPVCNLTTGTRYSTIHRAIEKAVSGDEILVNPAVYNENITLSQKNITIRSIDPNDPNIVAETVINGITNDSAVTFIGEIDSNCVIEGFTIKGKGNGIYCEDFASPTISKCVIIENSGDGISLYRGCNPVISECSIMNNKKCGIRMETKVSRTTYFNYPVIKNCVIASNGEYGISKHYPAIVNCTIADNSLCGLYNTTGSIVNSIIYFNDDGSAAKQVTGNQNIITYSDIQGSYSGTGNIDSDPLFADYENGDYHLMSQTGRWNPVNLTWTQDAASSPCIDAGDPNSDIGLEPVPNGSVINMGAYGGTDQASMSQ
jgi:parallel beta-helix repeat protein